jgi:hypothetical protein
VRSPLAKPVRRRASQHCHRKYSVIQGVCVARNILRLHASELASDKYINCAVCINLLARAKHGYPSSLSRRRWEEHIFVDWFRRRVVPASRAQAFRALSTGSHLWRISQESTAFSVVFGRGSVSRIYVELHPFTCKCVRLCSCA